MVLAPETYDPTKPEKPSRAPGRPGETPRWSSGAKTAVGSAVSESSHVSFTISNGTINELYYPDLDKANTRSIRFIVCDEQGFVSDEGTDAEHRVRPFEEGVPGYIIDTHCKAGRYRLQKEILCDPARDCVLIRVRFEPADALHLYLLIDPQLGDQGAGNSAWVGEWKGQPMLFAGQGNAALAAAGTAPILQATCGFVGSSDGLTDLREHARLTRRYNLAERGNVSLLAELDWQACDGEFVLSIALGSRPAEAALRAQAGRLQRFDPVREDFIAEWREVLQACRAVEEQPGAADLVPISCAVLRAHTCKSMPGGAVASLSIPWGFARGDQDTSGYHVLWPRDMVESAMGRLACGDAASARASLFYLACTQEQRGDWCQNMWLDGTVHWGARQMDNTALPILLADQLFREGELGGFDPWPMVCRAASFLIAEGPGTEQDRWEGIAGYAVFTMACEVAALLAAADFADRADQANAASFLRETADAWNEAIDNLVCVRDTKLSQQYDVAEYYVRVMPAGAIENRSRNRLHIRLPNLGPLSRNRLAVDVISPDALALVRFGLRAPSDPRIAGTVSLLDATLRRELATGPGWRRSSFDAYGEHEDGSPFDGSGIGRCWPLLAGERGHFELAAGNVEEARRLLRTIAAQTSECGMIPEQVWDAEDIPERELFNGRPTGSGMPLAWAHAEYIRLARSVREGRVWDMPPQTVQRYQRESHTAPFQIWSEREPREWVSAGKDLRIDLSVPSEVRWRVDGIDAAENVAPTEAPVLGRHCVRLDLKERTDWKRLHVRISQGGKKRKLTIHRREARDL